MNGAPYSIRPETWDGASWREAGPGEAAIFAIVDQAGQTVDYQASRAEALQAVERLDPPPVRPRRKMRPLTCMLALFAWSPALFMVTANGHLLGPFAWPLIGAWVIVAYRIWRHFCPPGGRI